MAKQYFDVKLQTGEYIRDCTVRDHPALWSFVEIKTSDGEIRVINTNAVIEMRPTEEQSDRPPITIL